MSCTPSLRLTSAHFLSLSESSQSNLSICKEHVLPIDGAGIEALNQSQQGRHVEVFGSDPANPKYGALLEVFHQLHCLVSFDISHFSGYSTKYLLSGQNVLRQHSWGLEKFNRSWGELYPSFMEDRLLTRMHVDHCLETLRLSLMCSADVTPLLYVYDKDNVLGHRPDFNTHHKCRDFNKIVDFVKENAVELDFDR